MLFLSRPHHEAVVGQLRERLADKQAELDRTLTALGDARRECDRFRELFVQAMGAKWNEPSPIAEMPLQTRTLQPAAVTDFETMASRWSPAEKAMYECWLQDQGADLDEPERVWLSQFGGASPLEVLS